MQSVKHHNARSGIFFQLHNFLKGKPCRAFLGSFGVRLSDKEDTAIMPDVVMVCDKSKLDEYGCTGAPDMIVEVLSTSTARYDRTVKFNKYRQSGVREYWMVEPSIGVVWACSLDSGNYFVKAYGDEDIAPVDVLPGCEINLRDVFAK